MRHPAPPAPSLLRRPNREIAPGDRANTTFTPFTTVNFGPNILVFSLSLLSSTALQVNLTTASNAVVGPRVISVTTAAQTLTLTNGLIVQAPVAAVVTGGSLSQGGTAFVRASVAVPRSFEPAIVGGVLTVGNASFLPSAGLLAISNRWLSSDTAELMIEVSPFANIATSASLVVAHTYDGVLETASNFGSIQFNPVTAVTVGAPGEPGNLLVPGEAGLFSVAVTNAPVSLNFVVTSGPGSTLLPRVRLYPAGSATPTTDVNTAVGTAPVATNGTYTFSVVDRNRGGGVVGYDYTFALVP